MIDVEKIAERKFWAIPKEGALDILETSVDGLREEEARLRLEQFGENKLPKVKRGSKLKIFLRQFKSPLISILLVAGVITLAIQDYKDSGFIFAAVLVNAVLGFYQENKAETALSNLGVYIKERTRVIRDGREKEIDAKKIVPGDIIRLISGARIPADARLIMTNELAVDEAILTGESLPVSKTVVPSNKNATIADRGSMVFSGTLVSAGVGLAVAISTGAETELGKIAVLVKAKDKDHTPLQTAISRFSMRVGVVLFVLAVSLFFIGVTLGYGVFDMFLISVAVAVSAVPEGLPIALTVVLAVGVERLARNKGVVRKLLAAEALGGTTLIMTDKTGTLTEAKMKLDKIISEKPNGKLLQYALLGVDVVIENPESPPEEWRIAGRPLEAAIVRAGVKYEVLLTNIQKDYKVLKRKPFNSTDKYSASQISKNSEKHWVYVGAPDVLVKKSKLNKAKKESFLSQIDDLAYSGYRVLGVAIDGSFLGLLAFNDPVRPSAKHAMEQIAAAGVRTVIATGDHKGTALSVAKKLGMGAMEEHVITGEEIRQMNKKELKDRLPSIRIFARVTPMDKLRIVGLYQELGEVVAVTGDGVNDAPALEGADIGVAMGSGTDVAKGASDLIILDDNFETIVTAVNEGRRVLENIRKIIVYLFSDTLDELLLIGGSLIIGIPLPLNAPQILWVNFMSGSFPAVALAFENDPSALESASMDLKKRLIDPEMRFLILVLGVISSAFLFFLYVALLRQGYDESTVKTFIFASFSVYTLFLVFSIKSLRRGIFTYNPFSNRYLVISVIFGLTLTLIAVYMPAAQSLLDTVSLPWQWLVGIVAVGLLNIAGVEFGKALFRKSK